jgi:hypothetical protein
MEDGEMHLMMSDSNNPDSVVMDSLITEVEPEMEVIWMLKENSGIKRIMAIIPSRPNPMLPGVVTGSHNPRRIQHGIPKFAPVPSAKERYFVIFKDMDGKPHLVDPYLIIPDN